MNPIDSTLKSKLDLARNEISWWYEIHRDFVPPFGSDEFARMVASGADLAYEIYPHLDSLSVENTETAYCDPEHRKIVLPAFYVSSDGLDALVGANVGPYSKYVSLALVNGSMVHEALHGTLTAYSPKYIFETLLPPVQRDQIRAQNLVPQFHAAFNILEDLAIEGYARAHTEWISKTVNEIVSVKNKFLLPREQFLENVESFDGSFDSLLNVIVGLKNTENRLDEISHIVTSGLDREMIAKRINGELKMRPASRVSLSSRAYDVACFVLRHANRVPKSSDRSSSADGHGGNPDYELKAPASDPEIRAFTASEKDKNVGRLVSKIKTDLIEIARKHMLANAARYESQDIVRLQNECKEIDIMSHEARRYLVGRFSSAQNVEIKPDLGFVRSLLQARTRNDVPGEPKVRGSKIVNTRLSRIATDGKIFSNPTRTELPKPLEVIVLIDFSGSTHCEVMYDDKVAGLYEFESSFAENFHTALRQAGIAHSIYAHTSSGEYPDVPLLFHVASFNMDGYGSTNLKERFDRMRQLGARENYDGVIYERIAKKFTRRPTRKLLIVLSDGEPAGRNYHGDIARNHTKEAISKLRKQGINVICFTIGSSYTMNLNNDIFGESNNVDASKSLKGEFERVIKQFDNL